MSQNSVQQKEISLKETLSILRESYDLLDNSRGKLTYLVTNKPIDMKESETLQGENATLALLGNMASNMRRIANDITALTNTIVGS